MNMKISEEMNSFAQDVRVFARSVGRELSMDEMNAVSGGGSTWTRIGSDCGPEYCIHTDKEDDSH